jgi:hypothetical protein
MNSQRQIHRLRVHLLAMAKLTQRALDYSIKSYSLRHPDFPRHVPLGDHDIEEHHHRIKELCRELMSGSIAKSSDARFTFAALCICNALHTMHASSLGIAQDAARLLESTGIQPCSALEAAGGHVNAAIRITVIALFARDVSHAHAVLRHKPWPQLHELNSVALHPHVHRWAGAQGDFERSVIRSLGAIAKQTHEVADAILFWLDGNSYAAAGVGNGSSTVRQQQAATPLSCLTLEGPFTSKISRRYSC